MNTLHHHYVQTSQDDCHIALICKYLKESREKYVEPYYHNGLGMIKFIKIMTTPNSKEYFIFMLLLNNVLMLILSHSDTDDGHVNYICVGYKHCQ